MIVIAPPTLEVPPPTPPIKRNDPPGDGIMGFDIVLVVGGAVMGGIVGPEIPVILWLDGAVPLPPVIVTEPPAPPENQYFSGDSYGHLWLESRISTHEHYCSWRRAISNSSRDILISSSDLKTQ